MSARGFLWRWNLRVLRNEWRQHFVIFALIAIGVCLSVGGMLAAYNLVEPPESEYGNGKLIATSSTPDQLENALASSNYRFARVESTTVQVAGSAQRLEARAFDQTAEVTAPLLELLSGDWPTAPDEVAVTDRAVIDGGSIGSTLDVAGLQFTVVGIVENPTRLADEFAFFNSLDTVDPGPSNRSVEFFVDAEPDQMRFGNVADLGLSNSDGPAVRTAMTMVVSVVSALGMLEVALLVGAGFAVIARRRARQFGLLAAAGATPRQVRSAATKAGVLIGLAGTAVGLVIGGVVGWLLLPQMENTAGHRITFSVPWPAIAFNSLLAMTIAGFAARWPTKALSKAPVVQLLSSLRPKPAPVGQLVALGVVLAAGGAVALGVGFAKLNTLLAVLGVLLAPVGLLLLSPALVKFIGPLSTRLPLASRMGGRAIARHNRRSASVVAALALALSIPVGVAVVTRSFDARAVALGPNVADNWLIGWQPGADDAAVRIPAALDPDVVTQSIDRVNDATIGLRVFAIQAAVPHRAQVESWNFGSAGTRRSVAPLMAGRPALPDCITCNSYGFGEVDAEGNEVAYAVSEAWIASEELLAVLGIEDEWLETLAGGVAKSDEYSIVSDSGVAASSDSMFIAQTWPNNARIPSALVAPSIVTPDRFDVVDVGFFAVSDQPISAELRTLIRTTVGPDLVMEFHEPPEPQSGLRAVGLIAGIVVGVGIALSAVGLFTAELANDLMVLSSIGASPLTTRQLVASVAAILAGAGAVLALVIGYLPLLPLLTAEELEFPFVVPWLTLAGFAVVFPSLAAVAGYLAGRNPTHVPMSS